MHNNLDNCDFITPAAFNSHSFNSHPAWTKCGKPATQWFLLKGSAASGVLPRCDECAKGYHKSYLKFTREEAEVYYIINQ